MDVASRGGNPVLHRLDPSAETPLWILAEASPATRTALLKGYRSGYIHPPFHEGDIPEGLLGDTDHVADPGPGRVRCPTCAGRGRWIDRLHWFGAGRHRTQTCPSCVGWGTLPERGLCAGGNAHQWRDGPTEGAARAGERLLLCDRCGEARLVDTTG
jgi:hypothetical protein